MTSSSYAMEREPGEISKGEKISEEKNIPTLVKQLRQELVGISVSENQLLKMLGTLDDILIIASSKKEQEVQALHDQIKTLKPKFKKSKGINVRCYSCNKVSFFHGQHKHRRNCLYCNKKIEFYTNLVY